MSQTGQILQTVILTGLLYVIQYLIHINVEYMITQCSTMLKFAVLYNVVKCKTNVCFQVYHLLFQGRIKEVRDLLTQHPDRNPDGQDVSAGYLCHDTIIQIFMKLVT